MTPDSTVPSDTDRLAEADAVAAVPDAAADIARKMLDQIVAAHASAAANAAELGEPYSAHPVSIEGDARAIVAAVTPILLAQLQGRLDTAEGQLATAREEAADMRAALERRLLQVKSIRRDGHTPIDPMLCTTPVTTVEEEIEDARLWWSAFDRDQSTRALGLGEGDGQ